MEPEIQILLNELINNTNKPDWWTIVITLVNATIMIWLGVNQYKLQKRQTHAQEYQIYKNIYSLISNTNYEMQTLLPTITNICHATYLHLNKDLLTHRLNHINNLIYTLDRDYLDFKLKISNQLFNVDEYRQILFMIKDIIIFIKSNIENGDIELEHGVVRINLETGNEDNAYAKHISTHLKNPNMGKMLYNDLLKFIEKKNVLLLNKDILNTIDNKCKIEL